MEEQKKTPKINVDEINNAITINMDAVKSELKDELKKELNREVLILDDRRGGKGIHFESSVKSFDELMRDVNKAKSEFFEDNNNHRREYHG